MTRFAALMRNAFPSFRYVRCLLLVPITKRCHKFPGNDSASFKWLDYWVLITALTEFSLVGVITVAEIIGVKRRTASVIVCGISYAFGIMLFAYIAHYINHWQTLQAVCSLPMLLLFGYFWLVLNSV